MEILVLEMDPPINDASGLFEETVLVPTMEIPTSSTGRYTPVTTPVHKSFILGEGIMGAVPLLSYPLDANRETIGAAVNVPNSESKALPIPSIDISSGNEALHTFRKSIENAMVYERQWLSSGITEVIDWMKKGAASNQDTIKEPVLRLILSIIKNADKHLESERSRQISLLLSTRVPSAQLASLRQELSNWSERAHTELRDQLDIAFGGQRWRKLGWWKLFWRVDDVSMITSDMLSRSFLIEAEKEIIFLAGRTEEAGIYRNIPLPSNSTQNSDWAYTPVPEAVPEGLPPSPKLRDVIPVVVDEDTPTRVKPQPWPLHIPIARTFLSTTTIPALQALAQKLVLQTLSTSSLTSALAGLMYNKWEAARKYWEGEVREEGRKAVRNVETIVGENLNKAEKGRGLDPAIEQDLEKAKEVIRYNRYPDTKLDQCRRRKVPINENSPNSENTQVRDKKIDEESTVSDDSKNNATSNNPSTASEGEVIISGNESNLIENQNGENDLSENNATADAPPLPEEPLPPLPNEQPPAAIQEDDGWAPVWDEANQAFYFYNRFTGATQWDNPRVPEVSQPGPPGVPCVKSDVATTESIPTPRPAGGYDPAIHGDYDPTAWYAQSPTVEEPTAVGSDPAAAYTATGQFNRFTGRWQAAELNPENFNDENKSKRQMNAFLRCRCCGK
ncbi:hypothetical protein EYC84_005089 [Monilinia fructicola]|uniref:WW domain-containing protein n=1 Tax=Monilinia fructicola TaxID=38448 RepID=A0A5M9JVG0_MONFR|nr:hypothetical protein EYC84_005089 [Monilinia fructicola]